MDIEIKETEQKKDKKIIGIEINNELYQKLRKIAFDMGLSLSATIRVMLNTYIGDHCSEEYKNEVLR